MSDYAGVATRDSLVLRYAERVQDNTADMPVTVTRVRRSTRGIHTFGRSPITRTRPGATRSRRAIATLMATAVLATATPAITHAQSSDSTHEIQSGDTLSQIAVNYGVSVDELLAWNNIDDPNLIFAGNELIVTVTSSDGSTDNGGNSNDIQVGDTVYEIQPGDTLMAIAMSHGVSLADVLALNGIENPDQIFAGDFLIIPTSGSSDSGNGSEAEVPVDADSVAPPPVEQPAEEPVEQPAEEPVEQPSDNGFDGNESHIIGLHLVARGETPHAIAQRYEITIDQLLQANDLSEGDSVSVGDMLRIPNAMWDPSVSSTLSKELNTTVASEPASVAMLENMPVQQQSLNLSTEAAALSMATEYWGFEVSEQVFIENLPFHPNPHQGFRGDMNGEPGGTADYGTYAKPLAAMVANQGFVGDEFYTMGDPTELKARIDDGQPVLVWMTSQAEPQERFSEWYQGERFTLVPQQTVVVAYGYDENNIYVADPETGEYETYTWDAFTSSWSLFDGMSLAIYPAG
jgi:LysM repeat protein